MPSSVIFKYLIFFIFSTLGSAQLGRNDYEYILPTRRATSCPSFASFRFSCQPDHVIGIDSLTFAPVQTEGDGDCTPNPFAECVDNDEALTYAQQECSNSEHCTLISYQLRAKTKCSFHSVISVIFKCIPTWEVMDVPTKCDICKNVTITNVLDQYGFIHSAWYPKLYPRVTCHSLIKNHPDKLIVIYSVSGSVGLDRIQIESVNQYGQLAYRETLTGNLTTKRVLVSAYDVNVTVLPEDAYFFEQRRFLFYFYLIPRCQLLHCQNGNITTNFHEIPTHPVITTFPITNETPNTGSSFAPPFKDNGQHPPKLSDAWLAAILALIYSLLMVVAVLTAIYCRRRRRQRLLKQSYMYSSGRGTSASSSTQIIPSGGLSRIPSQASMREHTTRSVANPVYLATPNTNYDLYAQMEREQHLQEQHDRIEREYQYQQHQQQLADNGSASVKITRNIPLNSVTRQNEFDNYSFTLNDENRGRMATETSSMHNTDRYDMTEHSAMYQRSQYTSNNDLDPPYIIKTSANLGSIMNGSSGGMSSQYNNDQTLKGIYRAVEYTKSPRVERVRIKNSEEYDYEHHMSGDYASHKYTRDMENNEFNHLQYRTPAATMNSEHDEKTFVVKLFPVDEHEKEVQEMTMFVESNEQHTRKY